MILKTAFNVECTRVVVNAEGGGSGSNGLVGRGKFHFPTEQNFTVHLAPPPKKRVHRYRGREDIVRNP